MSDQSLNILLNRFPVEKMNHKQSKIDTFPWTESFFLDPTREVFVKLVRRATVHSLGLVLLRRHRCQGDGATVHGLAAVTIDRLYIKEAVTSEIDVNISRSLACDAELKCKTLRAQRCHHTNMLNFHL